MIGNNACGSHSVAWGKTVDNVHALDVLTYRGERLAVGPRSPPAPGIPGAARRWRRGSATTCAPRSPTLTRRVSGYNLDQLLPENGFDLARALVGTEGTCVTCSEATVRLVESPAVRALAVLGFPDAYTAADHVHAVRALQPADHRGHGRRADRGAAGAQPGTRPRRGRCREGGGWLYVETGGRHPRRGRGGGARRSARRCRRRTALVVGDPAAQRALWRIREDGAGIVTRSPGRRRGVAGLGGRRRAARAVRRLPAGVRRAAAPSTAAAAPTTATSATAACTSGSTSTCSPSRGVAGFRAFMEDAADLAVAHGGSLSGEHGDGRARAELLPRMYPPEIIDGVRRVQGHLGPGRPDEPRPGRAARAGSTRTCACSSACRRCATAGAGVHRRPRLVRPGHPPLPGRRASASRRRGGVMCPSYRATGEEQHSTRGRARLLFEMAPAR